MEVDPSNPRLVINEPGVEYRVAPLEADHPDTAAEGN